MFNLINCMVLKNGNNNNYKTLSNWADFYIRWNLSGKTKSEIDREAENIRL